MPIGAGWDSPGARLRTERFQRRREEVVGALGPMLAEGLQSATTATDQSLTELASSQGMFNLRAPTIAPAPLRPAPIPTPTALPPPSVTPTPERPPVFGLQAPTRVRPIGPGPDVELSLQDLAGMQATTEERRRPVGIGENLRGLLRELEAEVELGRPLTEPVGRFVGGLIGQQFAPTTPPGLRALGVPDIPGTQRAREIGADVGGVVGPELGVLSNIVPIPIVDDVLRVLAKGAPLAARLLTRTGRTATRAELRELANAAGRWLTGAAPITPAERELGEQGVEALTREAAEAAPAAAAGGGLVEDAPPVGALDQAEGRSVARRAGDIKEHADSGGAIGHSGNFDFNPQLHIEATYRSLGGGRYELQLSTGQRVRGTAEELAKWERDHLANATEEGYKRLLAEGGQSVVSDRELLRSGVEGSQLAAYHDAVRAARLEGGARAGADVPQPQPRAGAAGEAAPRAIEDAVIDQPRQIHRLTGEGGQLDYRLTPEGAHLMDVSAPGRGQEFFDELRSRVPGTITGDLNTEAGARLFARQPGAQFTEFPSGRAITPDEAIAQAGAGRGPRVEVPGGVPEAAPARVPEAAQPAAARPLLGRPLSEQTAGEFVFHETSADTARLFLQEGTVPSQAFAGRSGVFVSDAPELALGQAGKGATIRLRAGSLSGRVQRPPGQPEFMARELGTNFVTEDALADAVVDVTFRPEALRADRVARRWIENIEQIGGFAGRDFTVTRQADGSVVVTSAGRKAQPSPAPARAAGEAAPQMAGGSPLTAAEVASRRAAGADLLAEAIPQSGSRAGRDVWRRFFGARNRSARERRVWSREVYTDAERAGFKIAARGETQADEVIGIMERVMDEQRAPVTNFPERQRPFVQSLYDRIDRTTQRLIDADPDFANIALEDYFPHLFKPIKEGAGRLGRATGFVTKPGFKRPRKLTGTLGEILNDRPDLDLVSWDPVDFVTRHEAAADNYIASLEAIRAGKASGHILPASQAPADWVRPDFAPFKLRQTLQHWAMEPKFAQTMEQMFGTSAFDKHGVLKFAKQVRTTGFALKVFGGLFQQLDFMWRSLGLGVSELARGRPGQAAKAVAAWPRAMARGISPNLDDAATRRALKDPKMQALLEHGHAGGYDPSFSETALRDVAAEIGPIPGVRQALQTVTSDWYGRFHAAILDEAALVMLEKNLRKGLPLEEAARLAVEENNVFFSSIPAWQSVWKSATVRDAMKFPFFATGELEGWFRLPVQAPAGFAGMMATTVAVAEMMSLAFTGKPLSLEQLTPFQRERDGLKPSKILTGDIPFVDFNTGFLRPELPWKGPMGRTLYLDLLGQADTPFRWALDPGFATQTRLGQLPRLAIDLASIARGEAPPFGEVVKGPLDALQFVLQQISPISISGLTGTERGRIGVAGAGTQVGGFNVSAEPLFELLGRRFEELTGDVFNDETDWGRAAQLPETAAILEEMRRQGIAVGSQGALAAQAREEVVQQAARDSLTQFADGVRAGNADAGRRFGEKFSDWKTFAAGAAELSIFGRDFPDPTTPQGQILAEFYEITPDAFLDGDPEQGTFTTDWVAFENARDEKLAQMPQAWRDAYEAQLRLPPELQDVEARYNAARELRNDLEEIGEFEGLSREDYQLVKRLRAAVTRAREQAWNDPARSGRELAPVRSFIETEGQRLGYDERLINWTLALSSERHRARNYNPAYVDFLGEHEADLRLFYPQLFTRRVTDELLRRP